MNQPETIIASAFVAGSWLILAAGLFHALKTGVDPAQGRYAEASRAANPLAYWVRVLAMAGGLVFFSILAFALVQQFTGVSE
ncbi:hypothetical protein [Novosphingobium sp.]|uniref:hypothetical protein n=1 Tax=Novosphingobium sp. TaxID=1874826 RepID=UPI0035B37C94